MEQNNYQENKLKKFLPFALGLAALAAIVLIYLLSNTNNQVDNTEFTNIDLTEIQNNPDEALKGFPSDLPIETDVRGKYKLDYQNSQASQYTLSYNTELSAEEVYVKYWEYMEESGYEFYEGGEIAPTQSFNGYLSGKKDNDDLVVSIAEQEAGTQVQLTFLNR